MLRRLQLQINKGTVAHDETTPEETSGEVSTEWDTGVIELSKQQARLEELTRQLAEKVAGGTR